MLTSSIAHVLDRRSRAVSDLQRTIPPDFRAFEICLEERAHLGISRARLGQDCEVDGEAEHIDQERENDEPNDSCCNMGTKLKLCHRKHMADYYTPSRGDLREAS